jgi:RHS repeat-associated protein
MWNWHYAQSMEDSAGRYSKHVYLDDTRIVTKIAKANSNLLTSTQEETAKQYYYHSDHLGSAQLISDAQGREYERLEYTPYGEIWIDKSQAASEIDVPFRFTGKERDVETGLYYYGARYLDAKTSRWLSTDPALGEYVPGAPINDEAKKRNGNLPGMGGVYNVVNFHLYHYAGNNPVKYTDPDGQTASFEIDDENKTVNITIDIVIYGKDANVNVAQDYEQSILDQWGRDGSDNAWQMNINGENYSVNFDVNVTVGKRPGLLKKWWNAHFGTKNYINVDNEFARPNVVNGYLGTWIGSGTSQRNGYPFSMDNIPAHETGHLLGLRDRYSDNGAGISEPHTDWIGNIMASTFGTVDQRNINAIGGIISGHGKKGAIRSRGMIY